MKTKRVLVVDDDVAFSIMLTRMVQRGGCDVVAVADTRAALEQVRGRGIGLALIDVALGRENGWETLRLVRQESDVPVIMMTGGDISSETVTDARLLGATGVIGKPVDSGQLYDLLRELFCR
ncbi:MAG: response regulator [Elusimicrobiota bacterium]|jgi:DNA-binding response OmpR family regulator